MERYLIAYECTDTHDWETSERLTTVDNKKDTIDLIAAIVANPHDKLISIVQYNFIFHQSKILKPTLNSELKLDLEEVK